jgi:hypothetical protein
MTHDAVILTPGTCQYCACTDQSACPDGCDWTDETRLTCTRCAFAARIAVIHAHATAARRANGPLVAITEADLAAALADFTRRPFAERAIAVDVARLVVALVRTATEDELVATGLLDDDDDDTPRIVLP